MRNGLRMLEIRVSKDQRMLEREIEKEQENSSEKESKNTWEEGSENAR